MHTIPHSEEAKLKMSLAKKGNRNGQWKGAKVGYRALHYWVIRQKGIAKICEFCGKEKTTPKSIHWANKSHKYLRKLTDWISLCVKCHKAFDIGFKSGKVNIRIQL